MLPLVPRLSGVGFKILLDILLTAPRSLRVIETAIPVSAARERDLSKFDARAAYDFVYLLLDKSEGRWVPTRFLIFAAVGGLGLVVHLAAVWLLFAALGVAFRRRAARSDAGGDDHQLRAQQRADLSVTGACAAATCCAAGPTFALACSFRRLRQYRRSQPAVRREQPLVARGAGRHRGRSRLELRADQLLYLGPALTMSAGRLGAGIRPPHGCRARGRAVPRAGAPAGRSGGRNCSGPTRRSPGGGPEPLWPSCGGRGAALETNPPLYLQRRVAGYARCWATTRRRLRLPSALIGGPRRRRRVPARPVDRRQPRRAAGSPADSHRRAARLLQPGSPDLRPAQPARYAGGARLPDLLCTPRPRLRSTGEGRCWASRSTRPAPSRALYAHNTAALLPALANLVALGWWLCRPARPSRAGWWIGANLLVLAAWSWWLPTLLRQLGGADSLDWLTQPSPAWAARDLCGCMACAICPTVKLGQMLSGLPVLGIALLACIRRPGMATLLLGAVAFGVPAALFLAGLVGQPIWIERAVLLAAAPGLTLAALLVIACCARAGRAARRWRPCWRSRLANLGLLLAGPAEGALPRGAGGDRGRSPSRMTRSCSCIGRVGDGATYYQARRRPCDRWLWHRSRPRYALRWACPTTPCRCSRRGPPADFPGLRPSSRASPSVMTGSGCSTGGVSWPTPRRSSDHASRPWGER